MGELSHPDLNHAPPIGPHWDFKDIYGDEWRIFKGGSKIKKEDIIWKMIGD